MIGVYMSLLSIKIDELILLSGETVQSLADVGKINRTTLQRVKSGERLPMKTFFENMCKALRLPLTDYYYQLSNANVELSAIFPYSFLPRKMSLPYQKT